ncbi:hypothetical protein ACHAXT_004227 [Thalassiosira profunda]
MGRSSIGAVGTDFGTRHWLSLDPCGLLCLAFSFSLHLFALVASGLTLIAHHPAAQILYGALYVPLALLALWSLTAASTTDPGAVPMGARPIPANLAAESDSVVTERDEGRGGLRRRRGIRRCRKCRDNYKPARAHHDSVTGRCVVKMDHYCPWVGNAVGIMNHKFFILFILYTFLTAVVSLTLILMRVIRCGYWDASSSNAALEEHQCTSHHTVVILILGIVTILFFCFTFCMLLEQTEAIRTNVSKIARMKTRAGMVARPDEYAPVATEFNEVFGGEHSSPAWHWFLPLPVRFPEWAVDNIMGYEYDESFEAAPYREPDDGDADGRSAASGASSLGGRSSVDGGGGEGELGPLGGMDVETGNGMAVDGLDPEPLEQNLLQGEEREMLVASKRTSGLSAPAALLLLAAVVRPSHALSVAPADGLKIVGLPGGQIESLPPQYVRTFRRWVVDGLDGADADGPTPIEGAGLSNLDEGWVDPTSTSELWWPADLPALQVRPAINVLFRSGRLSYASAGLDVRAPQTITATSDGMETISWRNYGMHSQPLARQWTTLDIALERMFHVEGFIVRGDGEHEALFSSIPARGAMEQAATFAAELDGLSPMAEGFHIATFPLAERWTDLPCVEPSIDKGEDSGEDKDDSKSGKLYKLVCLATSEPFADKLLELDEDILTMSSTSVLEATVSRTAPGGDSPYLTEPYKALYLSEG